MSDLEIGSIERIQWLWLVAATVLTAALGAIWQRRAAMRFATPEMMDRVFPNRSSGRAFLSLTLLSIAMSLLVIGAIDLRWGQVQRQIPQKGIEVMFVLDVSRSMLAQDATPSRLQRAKQMIKDTIDEMAGDRVGLTIFAGRARQQIPMTSHYEDFKQALEDVGPHQLSRGGSRLGDAIRTANAGFLSQTNDHKAIVLLTDGEDQESEPIEAARQVREEQGVRIFTIGLGDFETGSRIPVFRSGAGTDYLTHDGEQVWSRLNGEVLEKIATESGGAYIPAGTKQVAMDDVYYGYIANIEQQEFQAANISSFEARYQWFLLPALVLLMAEVWIGAASRRNRRYPDVETTGQSDTHSSSDGHSPVPLGQNPGKSASDGLGVA